MYFLLYLYSSDTLSQSMLNFYWSAYINILLVL
nr:MAG TPA: hypothetical protein [Caudoviricetes sp.]